MSDDEDIDDPTDEGYESGPFCRHWSDPCDCEEKCAACGHTCARHGWDDCREQGCECLEFVEANEDS